MFRLYHEMIRRSITSEVIVSFQEVREDAYVNTVEGGSDYHAVTS